MLSSRAIVLSREIFGEADMYVQFFSKRWGLITVLAKAARKSKRRYVGGLDLFCHDEIFLRGTPRERAYLVELSVLNSFTKLREDLDKMLTAGKAIHWIKKLAEASTPMPEVYSLLGQTLSLIQDEENPERLHLLVLVFKMKLLLQVGLKPRIDACVKCGETAATTVYLDISAGGILCHQCTGGGLASHERVVLHDDERIFLDYVDRFRLTSWEQLAFPLAKTNALNRMMTQFASFHTHTRLPI